MEAPSPSKETSPRKDSLRDPLEDSDRGRLPSARPRARIGLRRSHSFNPPPSGLPDLPALQVRATLGLYCTASTPTCKYLQGLDLRLGMSAVSGFEQRLQRCAGQLSCLWCCATLHEEVLCCQAS